MFGNIEKAESNPTRCELASTSYQREKDVNVQPCLLTTDSNRTSTGTDELVSSPGSELTTSGSNVVLKSGHDSWCGQERSLQDGDFLDEADLKWLCGYNQSERSDPIPEDEEYLCSNSSRSPYHMDTTVAHVDMDSFYREDMSQFLAVSETSCQMKDTSSRLFQSEKDVNVSMNLSVDSLDSSLLEPDRIAQSCYPNRKNYTIAFSGSIHNDNGAFSAWKPSATASSGSFVLNRSHKTTDEREWRHYSVERAVYSDLVDSKICSEKSTKSLHHQDITYGQPETISVKHRDQRNAGKNQRMEGNLVEKFLNQRLSQNNDVDDDVTGTQVEDFDQPRAERRLTNWTDCQETGELATHVDVKFRSPRGRPISLAEGSGHRDRAPAAHRLSMPLVDNGMQTSSNENSCEIDANRVLYIYYPQYSMPNLQFLSETLETPRQNIALCPTPLCASKPLPTNANSNVRHRPLSCNDGESLRKQRLDKVTDWSTLWPLLPESVHSLLKNWNLPPDNCPSQHARLLKKINPTKFVNKYEIIQENAINSYGSSLRRSDSSGNYSLKDWLDRKMDAMIANNQTVIHDASHKNNNKTNIFNVNVKNLLAHDESDVRKPDQQGSVEQKKIRGSRRPEHEKKANIRKAERKKSQPSPSRQSFAGLTGPVYETLANIEKDSVGKLDDGKLDVDSFQLLKLCSCLHALLVHGMKADLQAHTRVPFTAAWLLIEAMTAEMRGYQEMKLFVDRLNSDCVLQDHTFKYCAFMSHLAESRHLVDFLSALSGCRGLVRRFYTVDAFMFQSSWAASKEFHRLLQKLSSLRVRHVRSRGGVTIAKPSTKTAASASVNDSGQKQINSPAQRISKHSNKDRQKPCEGRPEEVSETQENCPGTCTVACGEEIAQSSGDEKISRRNSDYDRLKSRERSRVSRIPRPVSDGCNYATTVFNVK